MQLHDECDLGLLDLKFKFKNGKTAVDFFCKTCYQLHICYITASSCYTHLAVTPKNTQQYTTWYCASLSCMCSSDEKFNFTANEQTYIKQQIIPRDYKLCIVNKHFEHVSCLCIEQARQKSTNKKVTQIKVLIQSTQ